MKLSGHHWLLAHAIAHPFAWLMAFLIGLGAQNEVVRILPEPFIDEPGPTPRHQLRSSDIIKNFGSKRDGLGLNVNVCVETMARMQGVNLNGFAEWSSSYPGGSYPTKLDKQIREFIEDTKRTFPVPTHVQTGYKDTDPDPVASMESWIRKRPVMVSYFGGEGTRYVRKIYSVVIVLDYDKDADKACFFDPNWVAPGARYVWTTAADLRKRMKGDQPAEKAWAVIVTKE